MLIKISPMPARFNNFEYELI